MRRIIPALLVSTALLRTAAGADAETDPAASDALDMRARFEQEFGRDSNPTQEDPRSPARTSSGEPDDFTRTLATIHLDARELPLAFKLMADCLEYEHAHQYADEKATGEVSFPFRVDESTKLAPFGSLQREWLAHQDYQETTRAGLRWQEDWSTDWSSTVSGSAGRVRYAAPNADLSGHEDRLDGSLTYWVPGTQTIASITGNGGLTRFSGDRSDQDYLQSNLGLDVDWRLPWRLDLDTAADGGPLRYDQANPRTGQQRVDRLWTVDAVLSRPIRRWIAVELGFEHDRTGSNMPGFSYTENRYYIGGVLRWH